VETGRGRVNAGGGADYPERRQPLSVTDQEGDRREAGLHREYPRGRGREAVCGPSLDVSPECVEAVCRTHARCEQVRAIEEDGSDQ